MFLFWNRVSRNTCYDRNSFFVSRRMTFARLPFNGKSPFGFGIWNFILTFCRRGLTFFVYLGLLLRFIIGTTLPLFSIAICLTSNSYNYYLVILSTIFLGFGIYNYFYYHEANQSLVKRLKTIYTLIKNQPFTSILFFFVFWSIAYLIRSIFAIDFTDFFTYYLVLICARHITTFIVKFLILVFSGSFNKISIIEAFKCTIKTIKLEDNILVFIFYCLGCYIRLNILPLLNLDIIFKNIGISIKELFNPLFIFLDSAIKFHFTAVYIINDSGCEPKKFELFFENENNSSNKKKESKILTCLDKKKESKILTALDKNNNAFRNIESLVNHKGYLPEVLAVGHRYNLGGKDYILDNDTRANKAQRTRAENFLTGLGYVCSQGLVPKVIAFGDSIPQQVPQRVIDIRYVHPQGSGNFPMFVIVTAIEQRRSTHADLITFLGQYRKVEFNYGFRERNYESKGFIRNVQFDEMPTLTNGTYDSSFRWMPIISSIQFNDLLISGPRPLEIRDSNIGYECKLYYSRSKYGLFRIVI